MHGIRFYRAPRDYPATLPSEEVVINAPPVVQPRQTGSAAWVQYLLPLLGSFGSLAFILIYHTNLLFIFIAIGMAFLSVGLGFLMRFLLQRQIKSQEKADSDAYMAYLAGLRTHLRDIALLQKQVNARLYPTSLRIAADVVKREHLWERRPDDQDFLHVRIGTGLVPLCSRVRLDLGNDPLIKYMPELRSQADALVKEYSYLDHAPIVMPLDKTGTLTLNGPVLATHSLLRTILCQIVAFHSPDDVRCITYFPREMTAEWNWLKWLPHVRRLRQIKQEKPDDPETLCLIADTVSEFQTILAEQIVPELDRRRLLSEDKREATAKLMRPHLILILDGFRSDGDLAQLSLFDMLFQDAAKLGITIICLVEDENQEPSTVQARITLSGEVLSFKEIAFGGRRLEGISGDTADIATCEQVARSLAPLSLAQKGNQQDLSQDIRLLDLLSLPSADGLLGQQLWQPRTREENLRIPIGKRRDGGVLLLDIKEAAEKGMGPHGLLVGTSGSGKSELLRSLIISLATQHDSQMINFILVDFKGGAAFADFAALPHVAGVITNLENDPTLIIRVYDSLLGEIQHRQRLLDEAGHLDNIGQYQSKRQSNPALEPMPHLMVIVDEFAQLITNKPEFLKLFQNIGQIGRSIGLHLLLSTQRIEEGNIRGLEGHLRYRICLRTLSVQESNAMLGTPDAYYLPSTPGVGYLKVDTDIYELFKTALITTRYESAIQQATPAMRIRRFTSIGQLVPVQRSTLVVSSSKNGEDQARREMDVVIERLATAQSARKQARTRQVWLPPLEKVLSLDGVFKKCQQSNLNGSGRQSSPPFGPLRIPLGLVDIPLHQAQEPLWLDFIGADGHFAVIGSTQSGKSTLLRTLIASFMVTHSPRDVQFYCVDLGGGLLRVFEGAPHIGAVCSKNERDKIQRLIRQIRVIIEERAFLLREQRIDMATYRLRRQAGEFSELPFGDVFLVIDNLAQFQRDFEQLDPDLVEIVTNGLTYGVHVILAANRWADLRTKIRESVGGRLELRLIDPIESEFGKAAAESLPTGIAGRGLTREKFHFQTALPLVGSNKVAKGIQNVQQALQNLVEETKSAWKGAPAPAIRLLPSLVNSQDLSLPGRNQSPGVPIGIDEFRLEPVYIDLISSSQPHFLIFGDTESGKTNLLRTWIRGLEQRYTPEQVMFAIADDYRKNLIDLAESKHLFAYACTTPMLQESIGRLKAELERRIQLSSQVSVQQLRNPQKWTGPHYFLFVDNYESLAAPTNPFVLLQELLLQGRDIGFHLIIARRVGGTARAFDAIMQRLKEMGSSGIILSGDPQEGPLLGNLRATLLPAGRGYLIQRNHPSTQIQLAFTES